MTGGIDSLGQPPVAHALHISLQRDAAQLPAVVFTGEKDWLEKSGKSN